MSEDFPSSPAPVRQKRLLNKNERTAENLAGPLYFVKENFHSGQMTVTGAAKNSVRNKAVSKLEISLNPVTISWAGLLGNASGSFVPAPVNLWRKADDYGNILENGGIFQRPLEQNA
jgi:hypothetical protein